MTGSSPEGLDTGKIVDKGIVSRYRQASTQDTFSVVSRKLFWVGTGLGVISERDSM